MRPLVEDERKVLDVMLAQDFPGAAELRAQLDAARYGANATAAVHQSTLSSRATFHELPLSVEPRSTPKSKESSAVA